MIDGSDITVIVPVWNRRELLARLLEKLRGQTWPIAEVLVVDNGSEDGAAELAEQHGAKVIRMGANAGFSRAVNRGIQESSTAWLAIVNNDVEPAPEWLEKLVTAAREPDVWFATGKIFSASQRDRIDGTYDALCRGGTAWRVGYGREDGPEFSVGRSIWCAPATAALFRAELFRQVGLFDERFESYLEDVDFGLRCACREFRGRYVPEAVAWHQGSGTLGRWHPEVVRRTARNQLLLIAKHYPGRLLVRYGWPILLAQALWGLVAMRHGAGWSFLRGKAEGLKLFGAVREEHRGRVPTPGCLAAVLRAGECEISHIQKRAGFDLYWRLYFLLTAGGAN